MEKNPWYKNVEGPFLQWQGPVGIKADGGGCTRGRGLVGSMVLHRAAHSRDKEGTCRLAPCRGATGGAWSDLNRGHRVGGNRSEIHYARDHPLSAIVAAVDGGADVNEVEAAGNTPLHSAAYEGWLEGCELLLGLGAKIDASNNAGDRPWHWARNMGHQDVMDFLEQVRVFVRVWILFGGVFVQGGDSDYAALSLSSLVPAHRGLPPSYPHPRLPTNSPTTNPPAERRVHGAGPGARPGSRAQGQGLFPARVLGAPPQAPRRVHGVAQAAGRCLRGRARQAHPRHVDRTRAVVVTTRLPNFCHRASGGVQEEGGGHS